MCQDSDHGGVRCPTDTSEARRLRRKATQLLDGFTTLPVKPVPGVTPEPLSGSMLVLKEQAEQLRKDAHGPTPDGLTQTEWDSQLELRVTSLGSALGEEADKIAGFNAVALERKFEAESSNSYGVYNEEKDAFNEKLDVALREWKKIVGKYVDNPNKLFERYTSVHDLTDEHEKMMTENDLNVASMVEKLFVEQAVLRGRYKEIDAAYNTYRDKEYAEQNKNLAAAYVEVLSQIRPLGGEVNFDATNCDIEAQNIFKNTVGAHYPSEWLETHNAAGGAEVVVSFEESGRPNYNKDNYSDVEDDGVVKERKQIGFMSTPNYLYANKLKKLYEQDEAYTVTVASATSWLGDKSYSMQIVHTGEELWDEKKHGGLVDGKPVGEGWVYKNSISSSTQLDDQNRKDDVERYNFLKKKVWVQPVTTLKKRTKTLSFYSPERASSLAGADNTFYDVPNAVAYHEFGHRMEEVLPNNVLPRQEKAFLQRRTGKSEEEWFTEMKESGSFGELMHNADLPSAYAGRDYLTGKNYEVFTVGIESLYGGAYGGLVGNTKDYLRCDNDYRGFVLGALASL